MIRVNLIRVIKQGSPADETFRQWYTMYQNNKNGIFSLIIAPCYTFASQVY